MKRVLILAASAQLLLAAMPVIPAMAQPELRAESGSHPEYLDGLAQLFTASNRIAPDMLQSEGPLLRISPDGPPATVEGADLNEADRELLAAARRLFALYRDIGGKVDGRALLFQRTRGGLFVAREGMTGALSGSLGVGMGSALLALARSDTSLPEPAAAWVRNLAAGLAQPGKSPPPFPIARLPRDEATVITLSGPEIAGAGADPILAGPPGSMINIISNTGGQIRARAVLPASTPPGFSKLYLYRAGNALSPIADFDIAVGASTAGAGNPARGVDDFGAAASSATPLLRPGERQASRNGQITAAGDVDMFSLNVTSAGMLAVNSRGSSDVSARLLDRRGNAIASNDDGGGGYNFALRAPVSPGQYLLSVKHCCGGGGNYHIDAGFTQQ